MSGGGRTLETTGVYGSIIVCMGSVITIILIIGTNILSVDRGVGAGGRVGSTVRCEAVGAG